MMKLALMRTATGKEDPELPEYKFIPQLFRKKQNLEKELQASDCSPNKCFTDFK